MPATFRSFHDTLNGDMDEVEKLLGADHVEWVKARPFPAAYCDCRAAGYWDANCGESFWAYKMLAKLLTEVR